MLAEQLTFLQADFPPSSSPCAHGLQLPKLDPLSPAPQPLSTDWHEAESVLDFDQGSGG